jgi:CRP/FNR family transcriptional regulator, cyclic AMP receptor protein
MGVAVISSSPVLRAGQRMATAEAVALAAVPLFAGIPAPELERVAHFMTPFEADTGEALFRQGDNGDRLYVIDRGRVDVEVESTGGRMHTVASAGSGEILGEVALLGGTRRSGTAVARERVAGWVLHQSNLEMLRLDAGAGSVELTAALMELVLGRLRDRYGAIAHELALQDATPPPPSGEPAQRAPAARGTTAYLETLLCFRHFHDRGQIEAALEGAETLELPAGAVAMTPDVPAGELLLVLRGALDVSIRRGRSARRVRLAGPGRMVGHVGALDGRPSPVLAQAREHVVLLALPAPRVQAMLRDRQAPARRFCAGLAEDIGRALRQAERPTARMVTEPRALAISPTQHTRQR